MQRVRTIAALILAVFWLPITMHCQLEILPGFQYLACCPHHCPEPHQDNDCDEDGCAVVESGHYFAQVHQVEIFVPLGSPIHYLSDEFAAGLCAPDLHHIVLRAIPPDTPLPWHVAQRAALSPRAPSCVT